MNMHTAGFLLKIKILPQVGNENNRTKPQIYLKKKYPLICQTEVTYSPEIMSRDSKYRAWYHVSSFILLRSKEKYS